MSTIYIVHNDDYTILGIYPTFESAEDALESLSDRSYLTKYLAIVRNEMSKELILAYGLDNSFEQPKSDPDEGFWVYTRKVIHKMVRL